MLNLSVRRLSMVLHLALALILAIEAAVTLIHAMSDHQDLHLLAFAAAEGIGAVLFIWPRTMRVGACWLVCVFLIAAVVHLLRGEFPSEHLVYAVAVLFVTIHGHEWRAAPGQAAA